jgi:hypothetical protein
MSVGNPRTWISTSDGEKVKRILSVSVWWTTGEINARLAPKVTSPRIIIEEPAALAKLWLADCWSKIRPYRSFLSRGFVDSPALPPRSQLQISAQLDSEIPWPLNLSGRLFAPDKRLQIKSIPSRPAWPNWGSLYRYLGLNEEFDIREPWKVRRQKRPIFTDWKANKSYSLKLVK